MEHQEITPSTKRDNQQNSSKMGEQCHHESSTKKEKTACTCCKSKKYRTAACLFLLLAAGLLFIYSSINKPTKDPNILAIEDIKAHLENPESFSVISVAKPDSAYGTYYFTYQEQAQINDIFLAGSMSACDKMTAALSVANEKKVNADYEYFKEVAPKYSDASQKILNNPKSKGNFSGWKVRTVYRYETSKGIPVKILRYTFLSPDYEKILGKIDVPLLREQVKNK